ncbi:furin-like protease 2 [Eurytemora carolleeae]|uniref:furin-like protease 2 n=1 Tax=Eurytemora carolleeae TaxID=1294199 RepID=UPI000C77D2B6|nr:furin-like protease 2 [Eurytemora carolleeae]|eukprot:XP_023335904.1 furin-like protease 2 [Eurytemora affinis]
MNVKPAWDLGFTGKGVVVTILDDGIQHNHPDLAQNYDPLASKDINDNDDDPMPQDNGDNKHGTRCAGEVAAVAYNDYCGVGIAYNASIGGVRMLDGMVNDAVEARSLSLNPSHIDIYSASWGPEDDGKTVDGPGPLAKQAFINGINKGRGGKGSLFVWASGNGGHHIDNCNCDGYTNSVFTLSISSATQGGLKPWYLEECSSTLATTYSSGTPGQDASITTVDQDARLRRDHLCTSAHTGTSASAPLAAAVCALALEANPELNWRDVQHIAIYTANPEPLRHEPGWEVNSVGRKSLFGYGLMDAEQMVRLAVVWREVPPQHICETRVETPNQVLPKSKGMKLNVSMITDGCDNMLSKVRYLEHVQCRISLKYFPRGHLKISLRSPRGTVSHLLLPRPRDTMASGFEDWPFLSVHFWGEDPTGEWTLEISNSETESANSDGLLKHWQLVLYGTVENPCKNLKNLGTRCNKPGQTDEVTVDINSTNNLQQNKVRESTPVPCDEECRKSCKNIRSDGVCLNFCPPSHYLSLARHTLSRMGLSTPGTCRPCSPSCKECFGPSSSQCLACSSSMLLLQDRGECTFQCPKGYYTDAINRTCLICDNCDSCTLDDGTVKCTSCKQGMVLLDGVCTAHCPFGHFTNKNSCTACHPSCETCTGVLDTQCGRCGEGTYYFERRCVSYCPPGYFSQEALRECMSCPHGCDSCTGIDDGACSRCRDGWITTEAGECLPPESRECQPGMYSGQGTCLACHNSCKTCIGPKDRDCSSCYSDHRLYISSCVEFCPVRSKPAESVNSCLACPHACAGCDEAKCTSCLPGYHLLQNGVCATSCPLGEYSDQDSICRPCHVNCLDCFGPGSNHCISCNTQKGLVYAGGECGTTCPQHYYPSHSCKSCPDESLEECPTCPPGLAGLVNCTNCETTALVNCTSCHNSCDSCAGPGPGNCTGCLLDEVLRDGYCLNCENGFYLSDTSQTCSPCHSSCSSCSGPDPNQCTSCSGPLQYDSWSSTCVPCCNALQDIVPCCLCGTQGVCTSPTRLTRSLVSSGSLGGILLLFLCIVGLSTGGLWMVSHCRTETVLRLRRPRLRRREIYSKISGTPDTDNSPFLREEESDTSEEEIESDFHMVNS